MAEITITLSNCTITELKALADVITGFQKVSISQHTETDLEARRVKARRQIRELIKESQKGTRSSKVSGIGKRGRPAKEKQIKQCAVCGKEFEKPVVLSQKRWEEKDCCSGKCTWAKKRGDSKPIVKKVQSKKKVDLTDTSVCIKCGSTLPEGRVAALCEECEKEEQYVRDNP